MKRLANFSYLIEERLAGSAHPGQGAVLAENLSALREEGFTCVLSVREEGIDPSMLSEFGMEGMHLRVRDFAAPTIRQIEDGVEFIRRNTAEGGRALVHCLMGYGRTGTLLACYLVAQGHAAPEAIRLVRLRRPGSIEDTSQEDVIFEYENHLKRLKKS